MLGHLSCQLSLPRGFTWVFATEQAFHRRHIITWRQFFISFAQDFRLTDLARTLKLAPCNHKNASTDSKRAK